MDQITVTVEGKSMMADAHTFSSGSVGFYASGKVSFGGETYQCSVSVVEVGSKPGSPAYEKKHAAAAAAAPVAAVKNGKAALS